MTRRALLLILYTCHLATGCNMAPYLQYLVLCRRAYINEKAMILIVYVFTLHLETHDHTRYNLFRFLIVRPLVEFEAALASS